LIEADKGKFHELVNNVKDYDCVCLNEYVSYPATNTLEKIFERNGITEEIDFLSIDINGDDYYVFESLEKLRPRVICCEYNPTIPFHIPLVGGRGTDFGCSALSLTRLAASKGYALVAVTVCNCIYVRNDLASGFSEYQTNLKYLSLDYLNRLNYIITDYKGNHLTNRQKFTYGFANPIENLPSGAKMYPLPISPVQ
jgi:hypothetical protein